MEMLPTVATIHLHRSAAFGSSDETSVISVPAPPRKRHNADLFDENSFFVHRAALTWHVERCSLNAPPSARFPLACRCRVLSLFRLDAHKEGRNACPQWSKICCAPLSVCCVLSLIMTVFPPCSRAETGVTLPDPSLPPLAGRWEQWPASAIARYSGTLVSRGETFEGEVRLQQINLREFRNVIAPLTVVTRFSGSKPSSRLTSPTTVIVSVAPSASCFRGTRTVNCSFTSLASGASAVVTLVVEPTATGALGNGVTVTSSTPDTATANNSANNSATITTQVSAVPKARVVAGQVITPWARPSRPR